MNKIILSVVTLCALSSFASANCPVLKGTFDGFCGGKYEKLKVALNSSCDAFKVNDKKYVIGEEVTKNSRPSLKKKRTETYKAKIMNVNDILSIKVDGTSISNTKVGDGYTLNMTIDYQQDYRLIDENTLQVARVITTAILPSDYCTFKRITE